MLIKCSECGNQISTQAKSCTHCGAPQKAPATKKQEIGCIPGLFIIGISIFVVCWFESDKTPTAPESPPPATPKIMFNQEGVNFMDDHIAYRVNKSWWGDRLSMNKYLNKRPHGRYLFIDLSTGNNDQIPRSIPVAILVDEVGNKYQPCTDCNGPEYIDFFEQFNPSLGKRALLIFDVPKNRKYILVIGIQKVELRPQENPPGEWYWTKAYVQPPEPAPEPKVEKPTPAEPPALKLNQVTP